MKYVVGFSACALLALVFSGCAFLGDRNQFRSDVRHRWDKMFRAEDSKSSSGQPEGVVANPPAKQIRFDGREVVLGSASQAGVTTAELRSQLEPLLAQNRQFSATQLVGRYPGVAEQLLWEQMATPTGNALVPFLAATLSHDLAVGVSWKGLLEKSQSSPTQAQKFFQLRQQFAQQLETESPSDDTCQQLRDAAQQLNHSLAMIDAYHLLAVRELVGGRNAWAKSLFLQAIELAEQGGDISRAADMGLTVAATENKSGKGAEAAEAWQKAVEQQLARQLDPNTKFAATFWSRADELRPAGTPWPKQLSQALLAHTQFVGCQLTAESPAELVLGCALGASEYATDEPQRALIQFKKAESLARDENVMWLRIAQSKCLATLGQTPVAAALLSGPAASSRPEIAAAAMAALGSAKLQAGAFQQGAQLLHKALHDTPTLDWSTRTAAEADLALALLIIGDTDAGLQKLQAVEQKFQALGDRVSLLHALENELEILSLEQRAEPIQRVQQQIAALEKS